MKKLFLLLIPITLITLCGCSKLGKSVQCTDVEDGHTYTMKVVGETNIRLLVEFDDGNFGIKQKSDWNMRNNCHRIGTEKQPPNMLSGYENIAEYLQ